ncbi:hypothetical protein NO559_16345 [Dasania sp. GY-MA-18]|uniref:hypothetical protein n=1 Tax=Dasania sp. GY-MA-18 TaxID=2966584 RepID=UPI0021ACECAF|nr:hypothetical protein [Dasania sp. GY-MA-18]MCR8924346.1 hypothetical protein [Dasania sp. GY-MA-18]
MVTVAYSSGKPSFGFGAGNVQNIFDDNIDYIAVADVVLRSEKMCPVLAAFEYEALEEAIDIARSNLEIKGHTSEIHSTSEEYISKIGLSSPVSRVAINEPCSLTNGFISTGT